MKILLQPHISGAHVSGGSHIRGLTYQGAHVSGGSHIRGLTYQGAHISGGSCPLISRFIGVEIAVGGAQVYGARGERSNLSFHLDKVKPYQPYPEVNAGHWREIPQVWGGVYGAAHY